MPTTLPRRQIPARSRRLKLALALAILIEGVTLSAVTPRAMAKDPTAETATFREQSIAQMLDAMLSP